MKWLNEIRRRKQPAPPPQRKICQICGEPLVYVRKHDAFCCPGCDEWREPQCSDPGCEFCARRPERPSETERGA